ARKRGLWFEPGTVRRLASSEGLVDLGIGQGSWTARRTSTLPTEV
ncbi:MAG: hypothetical protein ACJAUC_001078, partial [Planctomycetota bacterium]